MPDTAALQRAVPGGRYPLGNLSDRVWVKDCFLGSPDRGSVNIDLLKHQVLPVVIDVEEDLDNCLASSAVKQRYKCSLSVSEETGITVHPVQANI